MPTLQIPLTQNKYALIDAEDFDLVSGWTWSACKYGRTFYAKCSVRVAGKQTSVKMHRLIMSADEGEAVDHINGDGLDNRRCNLRLASKSQNGQNQANCRTHSSRFKGVSWDKQTGRWRSKIQCDGMTFHIGRFHSEIEAARAYDSAALELFGDYARLNFPEVNHA